MRAIFDDDVAALDELVAFRVDMHFVLQPAGLNYLHRALVTVTKMISPAIVARLLALGVDANAADSGGWTPLHYAARMKNVEVMRLLLDAGADPNALTAEMHTPLRKTLLTKPYSRNAIELLVSRGADVDRAGPGQRSDREVAETRIHGADRPLLDALGPQR